jgi:hypothetical protein
MGTIIQALLENLFVLDTSVVQLVQNLQQGIGRVKNYGQVQEVLQKVHPNQDKENISIFV